MRNKKSINFFFATIAFILGLTLLRQFDFKRLTFEHNGLAAIYIITFTASIFLLIKDYRSKTKN